ncbi:MAG: phosphopentomutase [Verrucomicrobiae bacterium]|nr:phosphopentomutase [Verrucomicrobiae bacterium]NNJ41874.1 phosphopentomutase [Akkermansiaceae bacterium]
MHTDRVILLVLDSLGIGASEDASHFGDSGADTLGHIAETLAPNRALHLPHMSQLGLMHAYRTSTGKFPASMSPPDSLIGSYACAKEISSGKDTPSGHWEMAGVPALWDWGYFHNKENAFPQDLLDKIIRRSGIAGSLGNCHASGTEIIGRLGEQHLITGHPIFYTSADSVFQIACHEESFGLENLYHLCELCREILTPYNIGRVIARPFTGSNSKDFQRTGNRHDYAIAPPKPTVLKKLTDAGGTVIAVGKIGDIFAHDGTSEEIRASGHPALWKETLAAMDRAPARSIIMTNFVDFDAVYGHRRDPIGYGRALEEFDGQLPQLFASMRSSDLLILTADHGNDPTWKGTDHTREHVPILIYQKNMTPTHLGFRDTFADIGQTIAQLFHLAPFEHGTALELSTQHDQLHP